MKIGRLFMVKAGKYNVNDTLNYSVTADERIYRE